MCNICTLDDCNLIPLEFCDTAQSEAKPRAIAPSRRFRVNPQVTFRGELIWAVTRDDHPKFARLSAMATPRDWMTLELHASIGRVESTAPTDVAGVRGFAHSDAEHLAHLMLESYRGTVDDEGETLDDARSAVGDLIAGRFGDVDWAASLVVEREGALASATIITRDRVAPPPLVAGEAFLAFSLTAPGWQRRGLARACLERSISILRSRGEARLHLVVTRTNTPAVTFYRSLGFQDGPIGGDRACL
jgi:ribosomal protein S18 acetylase RimI-like enzyme